MPRGLAPRGKLTDIPNNGAYRDRTCDLLVANQNIAQTNHINLPDFRGEPSVGAGHSLRRCRTLAGETDPQTDPQITSLFLLSAVPVPKASARRSLWVCAPG